MHFSVTGGSSSRLRADLERTTTVGDGETLAAVALRCGVLKAQLRRWNALGTTDIVNEGDILRVTEDSKFHPGIGQSQRQTSVDAIGAVFGSHATLNSTSSFRENPEWIWCAPHYQQLDGKT